ncbi:MAG: alpha/beta hydrolase [Pseudomonadota bacterium]
MILFTRFLCLALLGLLSPLVSSAADVPFQTTLDVVYGDASRPDRTLQSLDIYWKDNSRKRPVVVYLHDGGWAFGDKRDVHLKPRFFALHDMAFVSMNYRLRWEYTLYDQLTDLVAVVAWVKDNEARYGLDSTRVVLMGHGAGAHIAAMVGTDPAYLASAGLSLANIRSVVSIDSASFDIVRLMEEQGSYIERRRHRVVFGEDPAVWAASSPITHVAPGKGIPPFALLYVADSPTTADQARSFSRALRTADVNVVMIPGNDKTTQTIDQDLGSERDAPTLALIAFIRATL